VSQYSIFHVIATSEFLRKKLPQPYYPLWVNAADPWLKNESPNSVVALLIVLEKPVFCRGSKCSAGILVINGCLIEAARDENL